MELLRDKAFASFTVDLGSIPEEVTSRFYLCRSLGSEVTINCWFNKVLGEIFYYLDELAIKLYSDLHNTFANWKK